MGLVDVGDGKKVVIARIEGGRNARKKLMDLGLIPGVQVTIIRKAGPSPMLVSVMGRQVMIGHGMAQKVFVR
ncbi:MAG: FeoA domain-containing protein [Spirochaetaceae bacterium]|nr:FeoA domain-containing protein [Spirochaetaceae bacterium]MDT8299327.1 FeoA domain-containing protein [Spirochaetaceae bacterium]